MKKRKKMQVAIKVVFTKEFAGHLAGNIIATDMGTANFLIDKGVCEIFVEKAKAEIQKQPTIEPIKKEVVAAEKSKGRPKGTIKKKAKKK